MAEIKRPNYFTFQFLVEKDFDDEQLYHMDMRRRHNRLLHTWGVADGLEVTRVGANQVRVGAGTAIDRNGKEIVLEDALNHTLATAGNNIEVYLTISYQEALDPADHYTQGGVDDYTRTTERPMLSDGSAVPPADGSVIVLARIGLNASGVIESDASIDYIVRKSVSAKIAPLAIATQHIADGSITAGKLAPNAVDDLRIADGSVHTAELADGAVTLTKLATNSVDATKIIDLSVGTTEIGNQAVTNAKLALGSVDATKIAAGAVGTAQLADSAVTSTKLAPNSVDTTKIVDQSVDTKELADKAVTNVKLANGAVDASKIAMGAVGTAQLADSAVTIDKFGFLVWNGSFTVGANTTHGFGSGPSTQTPEHFLIGVVPTTANSTLSWQESIFCSSTGSISRSIVVSNSTSLTVAFNLKVYRIPLG